MLRPLCENESAYLYLLRTVFLRPIGISCAFIPHKHSKLTFDVAERLPFTSCEFERQMDI